jgi:hypothetical protein
MSIGAPAHGKPKWPSVVVTENETTVVASLDTPSFKTIPPRQDPPGAGLDVLRGG